MSTTTAHPNVVSKSTWEDAQRTFLDQEKEFTRLRDELSAKRRQLPWTKVEKPYTFDSEQGTVSLAALFGGKRQLVVYHFMFDPAWDEGCPGCSFLADNMDGARTHLLARDTELVYVSRAPLAKLLAFKQRMGWTIPWVSSFDTTFNYDFGVTMDETKGSTQYNYKDASKLQADGKIKHAKGEMPGASVFLRDNNTIYRTYSVYGRGLDPMLNTYNFLDLTALGRQENPDQPMSWVRHHDKYEHAQAASSCCCSSKAKA
ncbi:MAG: DUF899 domain-containing protein [Tepidisphaera sp.]|nr:DUF899 domain-containing protein [Tepidisphaera sp.]